jgi:hypothetical protein
LLLKDQDDLGVSGDSVKVSLSSEDTVMKSAWYELWVDWGNGQWQKQFKGKLTLNQSGNYVSN